MSANDLFRAHDCFVVSLVVVQVFDSQAVVSGI